MRNLKLILNGILKVLKGNTDPIFAPPTNLNSLETLLYKIYRALSETYNNGGGGGSVNSVTGDGVGGTATDVVMTFPTPLEINALSSTIIGEPLGSDIVLNVVSLTQAEYDAGTPISTTIYNITDA